MGDGGGSHPRDNIALSWLSDELGLSFNWFDNIMKQREVQTEMFADLIEEHYEDKKICIFGKSFKPETNLTVGSPAILLKNILEDRGHEVFNWDPHVDDWDIVLDEEPCCYFIGTKHPEFISFPYEKGSVIIDPWRYISDIEGCMVIRYGDNIND